MDYIKIGGTIAGAVCGFVCAAVVFVYIVAPVLQYFGVML